LGKADHVGGTIDAHDLAVGHAIGQCGGNFAVATANVEDSLVTLEIKFLHEFESPALLRA